MKPLSGSTLDTVGERYCELCGAPRGDRHPPESVYERLVSVLCANANRRPTACIRALQQLARPDATKTDLAREVGVTRQELNRRIRSLKVVAGETVTYC